MQVAVICWSGILTNKHVFVLGMRPKELLVLGTLPRGYGDAHIGCRAQDLMVWGVGLRITST